MDLRNRHVPAKPKAKTRAPEPTGTQSQSQHKVKVETEEREMRDREIEHGDGDGNENRRDRADGGRHRVWLVYAVASGACAAFNGVFAKLTTTKLTADLSSAIAAFLGLSHHESVIQFLCRTIFFLLNILFNGIMWTFFTAALKKSTSATQVAVMNTSTNFLVTAIAGLLIFSESLPPLWWAGASLLVAGSVIAGRRDQEAEAKSEAELEAVAAAGTAVALAAEAGEGRGPGSQRGGGEGERRAGMKPYRDRPSDDEDTPHLESL